MSLYGVSIFQLASVKANEGKSQEEQVPIRPFTQTEEIVLDILGKGSGTTQKTEVDLSDFPVQGTVRVRKISIEEMECWFYSSCKLIYF